MSSFVSPSHDLPEGTSFSWPSAGMAYGGDYSPEQWPEYVWKDDVALMREAGVNLVNLGVFSWGLIEVSDGKFEWGWLDRIMDMLDAGGIGVNLATPTAAPPVWLLQAHPEISTVDAHGVRVHQGGRLAWSPASRIFRQYALRMVEELAARYSSHPALRMWHVSNEIGNENGWTFDAETELDWQGWLRNKYGAIETLNAAWGTAFWGHHYTDFAQVIPPRHSRTQHNPGLLLDFDRFTSDSLLSHYLAEREVLRRVTPHIPVTTNFMVQRSPGAGFYRRWAEEVDVVANDHYTMGTDDRRAEELAFSADRVRGLAGGRPWLLIEHSTAAVNWQKVNRAKGPGEMARNTLSHIARGADGAMFFQWRQSTAGAEQFHSAMVPHAGADSQIFRDVVRLGEKLRTLAPVVGSRVEKAQIALLFDHDAIAALRSGAKPSDLIGDTDLPRAFHDAASANGFAVDVISPEDDLSGYRVILVPTLYLTTDAAAAAIASAVESGAHVLISYLSGIVNESNRVREGGYPGAFRELLGVHVDEFFPLVSGESVTVDDGSTGTFWSERVALRGAEAVSNFTDGPLAGLPARTTRAVGKGSASYLATRLEEADLRATVGEIASRAGVSPVARAGGELERVRRVHDDGRSYLFAINHTDAPVELDANGREMFTGDLVNGRISVPAFDVRVIEERI
ncbi:beta-galactosidase [Microbacterium endophyticum]|uniref:Beta-galactosidase n=1 Tax=Microbacterium endophyticum TaxID=1526412 RepID=A0A7W4V4R4_9MICO|nr:beta-galactosidase [Microbacterium endophyticum]MBB2976504.1 beta-galactosidase [Microbacterium endophyticum]NIK35950.1 beta-galactosidase [Microbacterium endophyticum]